MIHSPFMGTISKRILLAFCFCLVAQGILFSQAAKNDKKIGASVSVFGKTYLGLNDTLTNKKFFSTRYLPSIEFTGEAIYSNNLILEGKLGYHAQEFSFQGDSSTDKTLFVKFTGFSAHGGFKFYYQNFYRRGFVPFGGIYLTSFFNSFTTASENLEFNEKSASSNILSYYVTTGMDYQFKTALLRFSVSVFPEAAASKPVELLPNREVFANMGSPVFSLGVTSFFI